MILAPMTGLLGVGGVTEMPSPHTAIQEHFLHRLLLYLMQCSSWHMEGGGQSSDHLCLDGIHDCSCVLSPSTVTVAAAAGMEPRSESVPATHLCQLQQEQGLLRDIAVQAY